MNLTFVFEIMMVLTMLAQWHFIMGLIFEITHVLNIRVFRTKPKQVAEEKVDPLSINDMREDSEDITQDGSSYKPIEEDAV